MNKPSGRFTGLRLYWNYSANYELVTFWEKGEHIGSVELDAASLVSFIAADAHEVAEWIRGRDRMATIPLGESDVLVATHSLRRLVVHSPAPFYQIKFKHKVAATTIDDSPIDCDGKSTLADILDDLGWSYSPEVTGPGCDLWDHNGTAYGRHDCVDAWAVLCNLGLVKVNR